MLAINFRHSSELTFFINLRSGEGPEANPIENILQTHTLNNRRKKCTVHFGLKTPELHFMLSLFFV